MLAKSRSQHAAQRGDSSVDGPPTVAGKSPTVLRKTSVLLKRPSDVLVAKSATVSLARPTSTASRVVVINTSVVTGKSQPAITISSSPAVKSACSRGTSEKTGLLATSVSSSSSKLATSNTVVIIRSASSASSSSNTDTKSTPAAPTLVKNSSGSVVMSVKKLPLKYEQRLLPARPMLTPMIRLPPLRHTSQQNTAVPVVQDKSKIASYHGNASAVSSEKTGVLLLQDRWKTSNTTYQAGHTRSVAVITLCVLVLHVVLKLQHEAGTLV